MSKPIPKKVLGVFISSIYVILLFAFSPGINFILKSLFIFMPHHNLYLEYAHHHEIPINNTPRTILHAPTILIDSNRSCKKTRPNMTVISILTSLTGHT